MLRRLYYTVFGIGALALGASHAQALPDRCADHAVIVAQLAEFYGENRRAGGRDADDAVIEIFVSASTGSWTLALTRPGGPTCLIAAGQGFRALNRALPTLAYDI